MQKIKILSSIHPDELEKEFENWVAEEKCYVYEIKPTIAVTPPSDIKHYLFILYGGYEGTIEERE